MTVRRLRNVAAAVILLIATVLLYLQHQSKLPEAYQFRRPSFGGSGDDVNTPAIPHDDGLLIVKPKPGMETPSDVPENVPPPNSPTENIPPSQAHPGFGSHPPDLPPSSDLQPPTEPEISIPVVPETNPPVDADANPKPFEAEFLFQQDLQLDLPIEQLKVFSSNQPHNYDPNGPKTYAYSTFMATRNPSLKDPYYMAIHSLIYRVLWSPRSRTEKYPFIVFVADFVTPEQRQLLTGAGAIVRELSPLEWNPNVPGIQHRWKDLFAKLNMWGQTDFARILFLDADAFPVENIDSMFDISPVQDCLELKLEPDDVLVDGTQVCEPYVFAGVPQDPFNETDVNINVGSMVFSPSERMHQRLLQNYVKTDRYNCLMAEQAFLNWQFNLNGAFPAHMLEREWGGFFPSEDDEGKLKVVHEKLWSDDRTWLKQEWLTQWQEMLTFYTGMEFPEKRKADGMML